MKKDAKEKNLAELQRVVALHKGNVREAVRYWSRLSIAGLAERAGIGRKDADMCLGKTYGRVYPGARRALEVALDIPQYSLDTILDGGQDGARRGD